MTGHQKIVFGVLRLTGGVKCFGVNKRVVGRIVTSLSIKKNFFSHGLAIEAQLSILTLVLVLWLNRVVRCMEIIFLAVGSTVTCRGEIDGKSLGDPCSKVRQRLRLVAQD